jgi:hypothetical protein
MRSEPVWFLRRYINSMIIDVRDNPKGVVIEVGPPGYRGRSRLLLTGITAATEIRTPRPRDADDDQAQIDIGDDMYERSRYDKEDL